jgi:protein TonB
MPLFLSGGVSRQASVSNLGRTLSVRVVPQLEPQIAETVPQAPRVEEAHVAAQPRAERVERERVAVAPAVPQPEPAHSSGSVPEAPDLTYYAAKQLDVYPALSAPLDLRYRGKAADDGVSGRVQLLVLIDELGTVRDVSVVGAEPANYFEDEAKRAIVSTRFMPAYRNGRAVRSRVLIELNYGVP